MSLTTQKQFVIVYVIVLCITTSSCRWCNPRALTKPPNESDLIGIWKTSDGTEVIELKDDYTAIGTGEKMFSNWSSNFSYFKNIQGEWKIEEFPSGYYHINIYWNSRNGFKGFPDQITIWDEPPPHTLLIILGDPDEGNALFFYREGDSKE